MRNHAVLSVMLVCVKLKEEGRLHVTQPGYKQRKRSHIVAPTLPDPRDGGVLP